MAKTRILDVITPEQAMMVLKELVKTSPEIRRKARRLALKLIGDVDVEGGAEEVFWDLDSIAVEEVGDRSGRKRDGYVDPGEAAWQVFKEALTPELDSLRRFQRLGWTPQAKLQCMGILKGIYRFEIYRHVRMRRHDGRDGDAGRNHHPVSVRQDGRRSVP